ncbi:DUF6093 family protein [Streptomyces sp. NPDC049577]|uniref:DUF6093 family protein n=1 Tax=Streptomyces sp. NPDC049577 TaxID=3155153 RepID=UPI00341FCF7C
MTAGQVAAAGRREAAALFQDACRIERAGESTASDGGVDSETTTVLYEGPCRLRETARAVSADSSGQAPVETWQYTVSVPVTVTAVRSYDAVVITASADPSAVELRLRVRSVGRGTHITARRLGCEEVSR